MKPNKVAIHTNKVLPYSETFIKNHIEGLQHFSVCLVGSDRVNNGLELAHTETEIITEQLLGKVQDKLYKAGFVSPSLYRKIKALNADLIHSHFGQNGYAMSTIARKLSIPHVVTFHGVDITIDEIDRVKHGRLLKDFSNNIDKLAKSGATFIAVSDFIRSKLIEKGFPQENIVTNYLGIDTEHFRPDESIERENAIVCVARHIECKGIRYLIDAFTDVVEKHPNWRLKLIGDGELTPALQEYANARAGVGEKVQFLGRLTQQEIIQELNKAKLYCQPSIQLANGQEEALALTIVEAQSMAVPAVVFDSGGMSEAIAPEISGLVAKQKDSKALTQRLLVLIEDEAMRAQFSLSARKFATETHCFSKQTQKLEKVYNTIIDSRNS
ncbi:glycosyltransferase [Vibrio fluminensis]|uniref:glycosyltransferase n=1 Tax=Vibrio fluminensis TaxID=2783614 RepID=UPI00188888D0|nr:glycosyltransferase [Vibrio fluminensis]